MKNLANCKPSEFLKQTNRVKKSLEKWLTDTDILNIRKNLPELKPITDDMSKEETEKAVEENKRRRNEQLRKNLSRMFDAICDEHPDETLELLALLCFVEPENVDDHTIDEYLESISDMIGSQTVIGFFTSLARWGQKNI